MAAAPESDSSPCHSTLTAWSWRPSQSRNPSSMTSRLLPAIGPPARRLKKTVEKVLTTGNEAGNEAGNEQRAPGGLTARSCAKSVQSIPRP